VFELRILVEDKKLTKALWVLDGLIVDQPVILPVRNATVKNGKVTATNPAGGGWEAVAQQLRDSKQAKVSRPDIQAAVLQAGMAIGSMGYVIKKLQAKKVLGKPGKGARGFPVLTAK